VTNGSYYPFYIGSTTYFRPQVHADKNAALWLELEFVGEGEGEEGIFSREAELSADV
jgi:hypothetical protein